MHVKGNMAPYLDAILINIKEGLQARGWALPPIYH